MSGRILSRMQNIDEQKRRRARNVAWMVGFGLLLINIVIGYPSCSQDSEPEAPSNEKSEAPG